MGKGQQTNSPATTGELKQGTIKRLVSDKGFGFIRTQNGQELFFHRSGCLDGGFDALAEGDKVSFRTGEPGPKGPRAEDVARV